MCSDEIVVTFSSFESEHMSDILHSNMDFLDSLLKRNIKRSELSKDAMQSYYVHTYSSHINKSGFCQFIHKFYNDKEFIIKIEHALANLHCYENLLLFNQVIHFIKKIEGVGYMGDIFDINCTHNFKEGNILKFFDKKFIKLQHKENLLQTNYKWLMNHPKLTVIKKHQLRDKILEIELHQMEQFKKDNPKHILVIKALCKQVNELYKCVTAGDPNNIYHSSWYFSTESGHYYMIEKDNKATMFSSKTKKAISSIDTKNYNLK